MIRFFERRQNFGTNTGCIVTCEFVAFRWLHLELLIEFAVRSKHSWPY